MNLINEIEGVLRAEDNIEFAYIFGSFAEGTMTNDSDIDIGIYVSKKLDSMEYLKLKRKLMDAISKEIDLVILNNSTPLLKQEVFKNGTRLFSRNERLENNFKVHSVFEYQDMKKYYDLSYEVMIEKLRKEVQADGKG